MNEPWQFLMLTLAGIAILFLGYRLKAIGVRGASVSRDENPIGYWVGMGVLAFGTIASFIVALWLSV